MRAECQRHLNDLALGEFRDLCWDPVEAQRAINFYEKHLKLNGGQFEGKPFLLHPAQDFIIGRFFGWMKGKPKAEGGKRRFRTLYAEMGKGNGKSPLAAGIGLFGLVADREGRPEIYAAATTKDQAMVIFRDAVAMVKLSPTLTDTVQITGGQNPWNLFTRKGGFLRAISPEAAHSGPRPHIALCDELHEHPSRAVIDMLEAGFKFREQPALIMITNSGFDQKTACWEEHERAVKVAKGEIEDDSLMTYVCDFDEGDDPMVDESCWIKANPLLNVTGGKGNRTILEMQYLRARVKDARNTPSKEAFIRRLHFCQWTTADSTWITADKIIPLIADFDPVELHAGKPVFSGLDLAASRDLLAKVNVVKTGEVQVTRTSSDGTPPVTVWEPTFDVWLEAWTPLDTLRQREITDKAPYTQWVDNGHLFAVPGPLVKRADVVRRMSYDYETYKMIGVAYDRYAFDTFADEMDAQALEVPTFEHPQGGGRKAYLPDANGETSRWTTVKNEEGQYIKVQNDRPSLWMPQSVRYLEAAILEGRIRFKRNPLLTSALLSVVLERDAYDNAWFAKRKSTQRIDPAVALAMGIGIAYAKLPKPTGSYIDTGEVLIV